MVLIRVRGRAWFAAPFSGWHYAGKVVFWEMTGYADCITLSASPIHPSGVRTSCEATTAYPLRVLLLHYALMHLPQAVIPAKAGIQWKYTSGVAGRRFCPLRGMKNHWMAVPRNSPQATRFPAFAGMTFCADQGAALIPLCDIRPRRCAKGVSACYSKAYTVQAVWRISRLKAAPPQTCRT